MSWLFGLLTCRRVELERKLAADTTTSDERKHRQLVLLGKKESTFLRLRRTKLGLDDFKTVKVIGKGAFGEVCQMGLESVVGAHASLLGEAGAEVGYWTNIRHEDASEE